MLLGKVPGVDVVIAYGPLVMYTSAHRALAHQFPDRRNDHLLDGIRCFRVPALLPCIPLCFEVFSFAAAGFGLLLHGVLQVVRLAIPLAILCAGTATELCACSADLLGSRRRQRGGH